jgi:hypothetical protein
MSIAAEGARLRNRSGARSCETPRMIAVILACLLFTGAGVAADSDAAREQPGLESAPRYEWRDAKGQFHRSNLPAHAFRADGRPAPSWDPNHPAGQQAALIRHLTERERQMKEAALTAEDVAAPAPERLQSIPRRRLGLGELLELEKNAGRPLPAR